jgi:hypothetical protein
MLFIGMGTEVIVFFISAFDRPFDKTTIDMTLDNHMVDVDEVPADGENAAAPVAAAVAPTVVTGGASAQKGAPAQTVVIGGGGVISGGVIGGGTTRVEEPATVTVETKGKSKKAETVDEPAVIKTEPAAPVVEQHVTTPAPAVSQETAEAMERATTSYVEHLNELNEMLEKVAAQSNRLTTDSEEMENLNRTLTGISRVYEMQLKSASMQINTQDEINEQTRRMAQQIQELNTIYARMIEAMTVNVPNIKG